MNTPKDPPIDPFDQAIEDTAEVLDVIAQDVLSDPDIVEGLNDPSRDDAW